MCPLAAKVQQKQSLLASAIQLQGDLQVLLRQLCHRYGVGGHAGRKIESDLKLRVEKLEIESSHRLKTESDLTVIRSANDILSDLTVSAAS